MKKYALVDWDGTVRRGYTLLQWMEHLTRRGFVAQSSLDKVSQAFLDHKQDKVTHDELAKRTAVIYGKSMAGLPVTVIGREAHPFMLKDKKRLFAESVQLLRHLRKREISIFIVSGAPAQVLSAYQKHYGFARVFGLELTTRNGCFTGLVAANPGISSGKRRVISGINSTQAGMAMIGIGNSESDAPLFKEVKTRIVVDNPALSQAVGSIHITPTRRISDVLTRLEKEIENYD